MENINRKTRPVLFTVVLVVVFIAGGLGGVVLDHSTIVQAFFPPAVTAYTSQTPASTPTSDPTLNSDLINQAWNDINQHYVDRSPMGRSAVWLTP